MQSPKQLVQVQHFSTQLAQPLLAAQAFSVEKER